MESTSEDLPIDFLSEKLALEHQLVRYDQFIGSLEQALKQFDALNEVSDMYSFKKVATQNLDYYRHRRELLAAYYGSF